MTLPIAWCLAALACTNTVAFCAQWLDKRLAIAGARRLRERTLLMLGLPLSAPGMLLGMRALSHKTRKTSFLAKAAFVGVVNLIETALLAWAWHAGIVRFA